MYEVQFFATDDADWGASVELFDDDTDLPLDITGMTFSLGISEDGVVLLSASTDDSTIVSPDDGVIQWQFTPTQLGALCPGTTYNVGLTVETADGTTQLLTGTLALIDGSVP